MNTEVEIKAWVSNVEDLQKSVVALPAEHLREYRKQDTYFHLMEGNAVKHAVRLRHDADTALVTVKEKTLRKGLEVSIEREFTVSDPQNFIHLLMRSHYREFITKQKIGNAYRYQNYLIELSQVDGLGSFIEIERITQGQADEGFIQESDKEIRELLARLNINAASIEERSYTSMLAHKQGKNYPSPVASTAQ